MIRFRVKELIADKSFRDGRRITVVEVAEESGVSRRALSAMANQRGYSTSTDTLDKLCKYFGCSLGDLAEFVADA